MTALGDARAQLVADLVALGVDVRESASTGHISPPAAIVSPGPVWLTTQAQLGAQIHGRLELSVTLMVGRIAAGASLADLETLIEKALPALTPHNWIVAPIAEPFAITIAGTEYLAAGVTLTRAIVFAGA